jgi:formylglycine-generating enzyme required for sulfatase activity
MGSDGPEAWPEDGEGPVREVTLSPFAIAPTTVSNAEFAAFAGATGYVTEAERFGWSFVFEPLLSRETARLTSQGAAAAPWWRAVERASWRHPEGPGSTLGDRAHHPVVHVSHTDALAYCAWAGAGLPTEAQWEYAARGGLEGCRFPWGDELPAGEWPCNIFQGEFPGRDTGEDGYRGTAPVDAFAPNAYGLHNMVGNVWEWTADWFSPRHPQTERVTRGGSYLCHDSYCNRYRTSARNALTPDSSTGNVGFRCVRR